MTVDQFLDRLERVRETGSNAWVAYCPSHEDRVASLSVGIGREGQILVHCHTGCAPDRIVAAADCTLAELYPEDRAPLFTEPGVLRVPAPRADRTGSSFLPRARPVVPVVTEFTVTRFHAQLLARPRILARLREVKGWSPETVGDLGLGWDGQRITFPVRAPGGALLGLLRYLPGGEPKMLATRGAPRELWPPPESMPKGPLVLVEGEPDAVSARVLGLQAVALPGAAKWRETWAERLTGRLLVVVSDCDEPGRQAAHRIAAELAGRADVRIVDIDPTRDDGHDLGDEVAAIAREGDVALRRLRARLEELAGLRGSKPARQPSQLSLGMAIERRNG